MLQEELPGTEGKIAYARQFYNDSVQSYNTKTQTFQLDPRQQFRFKQQYFQADEAGRSPVKVDFSS